MLIQQRRIRNLDRHLGFIEVGRPVVIGLSELDRHAQRLRQVGFPLPPELGTALLPPGLGPVSRFNAEGGWAIHKDRPKVTDYRQIEWTWQQWRGRDRDEMREIRDVPF